MGDGRPDALIVFGNEIAFVLLIAAWKVVIPA
jgi:hypothetical protein